MVAEHSAGRLPAGDLDTLVSTSGIRRVHVLAWRDLDDPEAGGSEIHAHQIVRRWAAAGIEVTVRTSGSPGLPEKCRRTGYEVVRRGGRYTAFPKAVVAELLGQHGPKDAIVEIWNGVPFMTPLWAYGPRMALLHHHHGLLWPTVLPRVAAQFGSFFERRLAPPFYRSTPVVTLSESSRAELCASLHLDEGKVHVVEPGVDERFTPGGARSVEPLVVVVGRLSSYKRVDMLIRAVELARKRIPETSLEVIGTGDAEGDLRRTAARMGAGGWIRIRGRVDDDGLLDAYRRAWVVASASSSEGWGMTLTEAARCGTPTVATRIPGHIDAIADGISGFLVDDERELVARLTEILGNPNLREQLGVSGEDWSRRFDWHQTATEAFRVLASTAR